MTGKAHKTIIIERRLPEHSRSVGCPGYKYTKMNKIENGIVQFKKIRETLTIVNKTRVEF